MSSQRLLVDTRPVIKSFEVRERRQFHEVEVTGLIHRQQCEMKARLLHLRRTTISPIARRDVRFIADDRLDSRILAQPVKLKCAVKISVIGDRHRIHPLGLHFRDKIRQTVRSVEHRELRVTMQMSKRARRVHERLLPNSLSRRKPPGFTSSMSLRARV